MEKTILDFAKTVRVTNSFVEGYDQLQKAIGIIEDHCNNENRTGNPHHDVIGILTPTFSTLTQAMLEYNNNFQIDINVERTTESIKDSISLEFLEELIGEDYLEPQMTELQEFKWDVMEHGGFLMKLYNTPYDRHSDIESDIELLISRFSENADLNDGENEDYDYLMTCKGLIKLTRGFLNYEHDNFGIQIHTRNSGPKRN